jgi:hypothetical protein
MVLSVVRICRAAEPVGGVDEPFPIIELVTQGPDGALKRHVMLHLDDGVIISNSDMNAVPSYHLFCRDDKRILKTPGVNVWLAELEQLPDGTTIDKVAKCTVPFCTQYGVDIAKEQARIDAVYKKKKFSFVASFADDKRHARAVYHALAGAYSGGHDP